MKFFVSYSRSVKQEVGKVVALLRAAGHEVWWDGDIPIIADWWATILDNIEWCEVCVFVVSEKSVQSAYCLAELKYATDRNRPILPFVIDDHAKYIIPPEVTPMRNQWFEYDGDPARMLRKILDASGKIQWTRYRDIPVPRPPEPNTGSESVAKQFQRAVSLAEDGHFEEAIKRFRNVASLDFTEWGDECQQWETRLQLYAPIAELVDHKATLKRARKKWDGYLKTYDADFDPLGIVGKLATSSAPPAISPSRQDEDYARQRARQDEDYAHERTLQDKDYARQRATDIFQHDDATPPPTLSRIQGREQILLHVEDILPPPFEWCEIPAGKVTLEETNNYGGARGGIFEIPAFKIAKYPITLRQYFAFANKSDGDADPKWWNFSEAARNYAGFRHRPDYIDCPDCPVTNVTWFDAVAFCHWLSAKSGLQITLPTEQQWQRAAIGDTGWEYPWGHIYHRNFANTSESGIGRPVSVTQYLAGSPFGVMDMSGNAWEWCLTVWQSDSAELDQQGKRCSRGGSYFDRAECAQATYRRGNAPAERADGMGFRICING